jgi:hypothetical protein
MSVTVTHPFEPFQKYAATGPLSPLVFAEATHAAEDEGRDVAAVEGAAARLAEANPVPECPGPHAAMATPPSSVAATSLVDRVSPVLIVPSDQNNAGSAHLAMR